MCEGNLYCVNKRIFNNKKYDKKKFIQQPVPKNAPIELPFY